VELLVPFVALLLLDVAALAWGVDSRDWGRDPVADGRPRRWI